MVASRWEEESVFADGGDSSRPAGDLVELLLLLPRNQAATLEKAAYERGLTVAQMLRRLIQEFTHRQRRPFADQVQ